MPARCQQSPLSVDVDPSVSKTQRTAKLKEWILNHNGQKLGFPIKNLFQELFLLHHSETNNLLAICSSHICPKYVQLFC